MPVADLSAQLHDLYASKCCAHDLPNLADDPGIPYLSRLLAMIVEGIWREKGFDPGTLNPDVTKAFAEKLWSGVMQGYGKDIVSLDYDTPDYNMLAALRRHVWQFSAAKNYTQMRQLTDALLDEKGMLRTFEQFNEAAFKINEDHMVRYLKAEYELAVAGGQMAGKWVEIEANKKILPLLQFDAVMDTQTTDLCRSLDGTTLPVGHAFWNRFYPPNHWGCRSTVRQLASGAVTPASKIPSADIPDMFKTNLGKAGLVFPKDHPYFSGLPDVVINPTRANLIPETFQKAFAKDLDSPLPDEFWRLVPENQYYGRRHSNGLKASGVAYFTPTSGDIVITKVKLWKKSDYYRRNVVVHETAHAIHYKNKLITDDFIQDNIRNRMDALVSALEKDGDLSDLASRFPMTRHSYNVAELTQLPEFAGMLREDVGSMLLGAMDAINGITLKGRASRVFGYGHSPRYMMTANNSYMEIFTHGFENRFVGNPVFEYLFPNTYEEMMRLIDDIIDNELTP